ncbi:hypothetical protein EJB05_54745, partial [Eragrostis curvula]
MPMRLDGASVAAAFAARIHGPQASPTLSASSSIPVVTASLNSNGEEIVLAAHMVFENMPARLLVLVVVFSSRLQVATITGSSKDFVQ